jgi:c-di-GMP-binding flagellar brake protein YcgR
MVISADGSLGMQGRESDDRRQYVRVSADFTVKLTYQDTVITYPAAFARDISTGGIGIEISGRYPDSYDKLTRMDGAVDVELDLGERGILNVRACVVWGHIEGGDPQKDRPFKIGLKFVDLEEEAKGRLQKFIERKVNEALSRHAASRAIRRTPLPGSNKGV